MIAGLVVLAAIIGFILWQRRKKAKEAASTSSPSTDKPTTPAIERFSPYPPPPVNYSPAYPPAPAPDGLVWLSRPRPASALPSTPSSSVPSSSLPSPSATPSNPYALAAVSSSPPEPSITLSDLPPTRLLVDASALKIDHSRLLGQSATGSVYLGKLHGELVVAIKLFTAASASPALKRTILAQAPIWESLAHPNIILIHAICVDPLMIATEYIRGSSLPVFLDSRDWDPSSGHRLLLDVATGMRYLHSLNIIHGNLKPRNVLVDDSEEPRGVLTDFALSPVDKGSVADHSGAPLIRPPEEYSGNRPSKQGDVFSFALLAYTVVSRGRHPAQELGSTPGEIQYRILVEQARPRRPMVVSDRMWRLIEMCWVQAPEARPGFSYIHDELAAFG